MLTVDVRSRVEPELKREAAAVLNAAGLDVSTAIRLFLRSVPKEVVTVARLQSRPASGSRSHSHLALVAMAERWPTRAMTTR